MSLDTAEHPHAAVRARRGNDVVLSLEDLEVHFTQAERGYLSQIVPGLGSGEEAVRAVDGVDLEISENDVIALVGESGCGKTTLGKAAVALQQPTGGNVKYRGQDVWEAKRQRNPDIPFSEIRRALQIVHQDPGSSLNPNRRVLQTLSGVLKRWHPDMDYRDREQRIHQLLERTGITPPEDYASRYPHQLSGGEQQRVALIRALLMNPDLILADEAVSALDVSLRVDMMDLMLELQDLVDTSYLFISHNLSNARYLVERANGRIGIMYLGEIVEMGPPEEILYDPQHPYTKALLWAAPELEYEDTTEEIPVRDIDIPDPVNPPSGCRFHTRCLEAREVCSEITPELMTANRENHAAACFRVEEDHEYWDSDPIDDETT